MGYVRTFLCEVTLNLKIYILKDDNKMSQSYHGLWKIQGPAVVTAGAITFSTCIGVDVQTRRQQRTFLLVLCAARVSARALVSFCPSLVGFCLQCAHDVPYILYMAPASTFATTNASSEYLETPKPQQQNTNSTAS